tara:strand:+ start:1239 stop:1667 length:429 start_codon:yes stop_codon:yes gene_type:complete
MTVETVVTDNGTESKNGKFSFDEGKGEMPLFDLGENSGFYFRPKSVSFGEKLNEQLVQNAFTKDNTKLPKNPYTLEMTKAGGKGRGLVVRKNYINSKPRLYGIVNNWNQDIILDESYSKRIIELAKESVARTMSDDDLANDA